MINWELPRGWVSYLILIYSVVGILALLLVHPLKEESAKSWVKVFLQNFLLHAYSIIGFIICSDFYQNFRIWLYRTEIFRFVIGNLVYHSRFYFIFFKKATIKFVPISLFIFGVFALIFLMLMLFLLLKEVKNRITTNSNQNQLLEKGKINFEKKAIQDSVAIEIANKFQFLNERKQQTFLEFIPKLIF